MQRLEFLAQGPPISLVAELRLRPYSSDVRATPWPRQPLSVPRNVSAKTPRQGEKSSRQSGSQHSLGLGWRPCWCTEARVECGVAVQGCLLTPNACPVVLSVRGAEATPHLRWSGAVGVCDRLMIHREPWLKHLRNVLPGAAGLQLTEHSRTPRQGRSRGTGPSSIGGVAHVPRPECHS